MWGLLLCRYLPGQYRSGGGGGRILKSSWVSPDCHLHSTIALHQAPACSPIVSAPVISLQFVLMYSDGVSAHRSALPLLVHELCVLKYSPTRPMSFRIRACIKRVNCLQQCAGPHRTLTSSSWAGSSSASSLALRFLRLRSFFCAIWSSIDEELSAECSQDDFCTVTLRLLLAMQIVMKICLQQ